MILSIKGKKQQLWFKKCSAVKVWHYAFECSEVKFPKEKHSDIF